MDGVHQLVVELELVFWGGAVAETRSDHMKKANHEYFRPVTVNRVCRGNCGAARHKFFVVKL